jgi:hypothetical protein
MLRSQLVTARIESTEYRQHLISNKTLALLGRSEARDEATAWLEGWSALSEAHGASD